MKCDSTPKILLQSPFPMEPLPEVVLFGFDDAAFPEQTNLETELYRGAGYQVVVPPGPKGSYDEAIGYCASAKVENTFRLWYIGSGLREGPVVVCYAERREEEEAWRKPDLGLVEWKEDKKRNNIVALPYPDDPIYLVAQAVIHDPEDPDPNRQYKIVYELGDITPDVLRPSFNVAFSPDGLHWTPSEHNPMQTPSPCFEMQGLARFNGKYYVNGQAFLVPYRALETFSSTDFEHWTYEKVGLDRTNLGKDEQVHLGAALWNRGNVILGIYGQWHGGPSWFPKDSKMDLGLVVSHDAINFTEPIPDFKLIEAVVQENPPAEFPKISQGQAIINHKSETLHFYQSWCSSGVRMARWERDRLGALKPRNSASAQATSCPILIQSGPAHLYANASGLNAANSYLTVDLLDHETGDAISGYSATVNESVFPDNLRKLVFDSLPLGRSFRIRVKFMGSISEQCKLHALYVGCSSSD